MAHLALIEKILMAHLALIDLHLVVNGEAGKGIEPLMDFSPSSFSLCRESRALVSLEGKLINCGF